MRIHSVQVPPQVPEEGAVMDLEQNLEVCLEMSLEVNQETNLVNRRALVMGTRKWTLKT